MSFTGSTTCNLLKTDMEDWEDQPPILKVRRMETLHGDYECVYYARRIDMGDIFYTIVEARRLSETEVEKFNKVNKI